jgi:SAM-dependent methyltransferase
MEARSSDLTIEFRSDRPPADAFEAVVRELEDGLHRAGVAFDARPGGVVRVGASPVGMVTAFEPGREVTLRWYAMPWGESKDATVRFRLEPEGVGSRILWSVSGWAGLFSESPDAFPDWVAAEVIPSILGRLLPEAVGDWFTDRRVRRPGGEEARKVYRDPAFHWPNFLLILDHLPLTAADRLLEVGCGGGVFLRKALESGCRATGVDHSPQMVSLARETNASAVTAGQLEVLPGEAGQLPVENARYTCCVSTGAIGFFPDPLEALTEMCRALRPGGRLVVYAGTPAMKGTPAAPEPVASRVRFFEAAELAELARHAGFVEVRVEEPDMEPYAKKAGVPEEALGLFRGSGGSLLLLARKPVRPSDAPESR